MKKKHPKQQQIGGELMIPAEVIQQLQQQQAPDQQQEWQPPLKYRLTT